MRKCYLLFILLVLFDFPYTVIDALTVVIVVRGEKLAATLQVELIVHKPLAIIIGFHLVDQILLGMDNRTHSVSLKDEIAFAKMFSPKFLIIKLIVDHRFFHVSDIKKYAGIVGYQQTC